MNDSMFSPPEPASEEAMVSAWNTLLLVDDEPNILAALSRLLRRDGYRLLRAGSGHEGLEMLARESVGVIVTDQRMPGMTGVEFLSEVRRRHPDTVRLVLSGYTDLQWITDSINKGEVYKFLTKPWDDQQLRDNIRDAFRHFRLKWQNQCLAHQLAEANGELAVINAQLVCRLEEDSHQLAVHSRSLRVSQEVLEFLPVGVVGLDEEGTIAVANRRLHQLLGARDILLGAEATECLPEALLRFLRHGPDDRACLELPGGSTVTVWRHRMGEGSSSAGLLGVLFHAGEREDDACG